MKLSSVQSNLRYALITLLMLSIAPVTRAKPPSSTQRPPLIFMTEVSPPGEVLNTQGQLDGPTVALINVLQQRLDENIKIQLWPWARAYQYALKKPNSVIFETLRNPAREPVFQWVGPLKRYTMALYGKKAHLNSTSGHQTLPGDYIACSNRGSAYTAQIEKMGFTKNVNLVITTKTGQCTDLLLKDRVDLAVLNEISSQQLASDSALQKVAPLGNIELYLAFSNDIPRNRVNRWQMALEQSYRDGTMRQLYQGIYPPSMIDWLEQYAKTNQVTAQSTAHEPH